MAGIISELRLPCSAPPRSGVEANPAPRSSLPHVVLALVCCIHLLTIRQGHGWGDDFAQYIAHARNLVEKQPYANTGYVLNPEAPEIGPSAYPPGLPVLLAPVYAACGLNFAAMKAVIAASLGLLLGLLVVLFRRDLSPLQTGVCLLLIGLNPYMFDLKEQVLSDLPFAAFVALSAVLVLRFEARPGPGPAMALGAAVYGAYAFRTVGALLMPALFLTAVTRLRAGRRMVLVAATGTFVVLAVSQAALFGWSSDYLLTLRKFDPAMLAYNLLFYPVSLYRLWGSGPTRNLALAVHAIAAAFAVYGYVKARSPRLRFLEYFALLLLLTLLVWPVKGSTRFLIPLVPLWLFYAVRGFGLASDRMPLRLRLSVGAAIAGAILGAVGASYYSYGVQRPPAGPAAPGFQRLARHIGRNTPDGSLILLAQPRALALFTSRRSAVCRCESADALLDYARRVGASYVLAHESFPVDRRRLAFLGHRPEWFQRVYAGDGYQLFRIDLRGQIATSPSVVALAP